MPKSKGFVVSVLGALMLGFPCSVLGGPNSGWSIHRIHAEENPTGIQFGFWANYSRMPEVLRVPGVPRAFLASWRKSIPDIECGTAMRDRSQKDVGGGHKESEVDCNDRSAITGVFSRHDPSRQAAPTQGK